MTDERFVVGSNEIGEIIVTDVETDRVYRYNDISRFFGLIRLLNEQQSEINSLKMELELISGEKLFSRRELERKVDEQQSTINELKEENKALKKFIKDNFNEMMDSKMVMRNE